MSPITFTMKTVGTGSCLGTKCKRGGWCQKIQKLSTELQILTKNPRPRPESGSPAPAKKLLPGPGWKLTPGRSLTDTLFERAVGIV